MFIKKEIEIHHKNPVGKLRSYDDLPVFSENLFCDSNELEILCITCHKKTHQ